MYAQASQVPSTLKPGLAKKLHSPTMLKDSDQSQSEKHRHRSLPSHQEKHRNRDDNSNRRKRPRSRSTEYIPSRERSPLIEEDHAEGIDLKSEVQRDAWMTASLNFEISRARQGSSSIPTTEREYQMSTELPSTTPAPAASENSYEIGDGGSDWRMRKLHRIYETALDKDISVEQVAIDHYGSLRLFDEAREEREELGRRKTCGISKTRVTGCLYDKRLEKEGTKVPEVKEEIEKIDQSTLNRLQANILKAKLKGLDVSNLEREYEGVEQKYRRQLNPDVILRLEDTRRMHGTWGNDMTIEEMVREEILTRNQIRGGEGRLLADRIAKDGKFTDSLDYLEENADSLAARVKKDIDLKNQSVAEYKKQHRIVENCPLCHHDSDAPLAPIVSLGSRTYLSLPTLPSLGPGHVLIVPLQHHVNTLQCDEDEWAEIRNFQKCLIKWAESRGKKMIFYELYMNPERHRHAVIECISLPPQTADLAPAYFKEAILGADEEWSQHNKLIDTSHLGKMGFRRKMVEYLPFFHVWFGINEGLGHVIEDGKKWSEAGSWDLGREVCCGLLRLGMEVSRAKGRWSGDDHERVAKFRQSWSKWDWTKMLEQS
ncbi:Pre-mRNA-splicing factor cwf19 [Neolecta irregularis DAH-3]|uniref:Pre-mRNA-splicing factor cwf19 n=1 Tax=Neolecta irregularis (strain DAH-3) TaxID=1198029 RepID=A0A1U7LJN8_NEOID|nr:Pre-mRNA-splicing factor cwf19 [Neolecta irregularis DAH-3]|eukprot:OLL22848.1 Pre-mRNA-splicing factor cwf19 [Neolecta irregularis DAH-3]